MFGDVGQCFLGNSVQGDLAFGRQPSGLERVALAMDFDSVVIRPLARVAWQGDTEPEVVEHRRPQSSRQEADVLVDHVRQIERTFQFVVADGLLLQVLLAPVPATDAAR
jgi:hypothetical protein